MKSVLLAILIIVGVSSAVSAQSRHERVKLTPLKEGGETVGFTLKLTLRPDVARDGSVVRIGIGRNNWAAFEATAPTPTVQPFGEKHRHAASNKGYGYAIYQTEKTGLTSNTPIELALPIRYSDLPADFVPGSEIDVFTAWNKPDGHNPTYWHVWGVNQNDTSLVAKTPLGKAVAAGTAKPAAAKTAAKAKTKLTTPRAATNAAAQPATAARAKAPRTTTANKPKATKAR